MDGAGRVALVTGASRGIGLEVARGLAQAGFRVLMTSRDAERGERARAAVGAAAEYLAADLSTRAGMRGLVDAVRARCDRLHVLVNNAGVFPRERRETADGLETAFAVNHLAYHVVTDLLLDRLEATGTPADPARVVAVASRAHRRARLDPDDLQLRGEWSGMRAYANSKLLNLLWTRALARRLDGRPVTVHACTPGGVATDLLDDFFAGWGVLPRLLRPVLRGFSRTPAEGADTPLWLATAPGAERRDGGYFADRTARTPSAAARDEALAEAAWERTVAIAGA